jgi:PhnB protein
MAKSVKPIPENYHSLTPNLVCNNASGAIDYYKKVFRATETTRMPGPDGSVIHAELKIGDSIIFINDAMNKTLAVVPEPGRSNPMYLHLYVPDVDAVFERAVTSGSRVDMPVQDMFWGDRYGKLTDPFGQQWGIATHVEDVAPEEVGRRQKAFFAKSAGGPS